MVLDRADAYIGVLIDDLVTRGTTEPYRMFTSRAEYRPVLRADNADQRLTPIGMKAGCVESERQRRFSAKIETLAAARTLAGRLTATPPQLARAGLAVNQDGVSRSALDLLRYPDISFAKVVGIWPELAGLSAEIVEQLEIDARYAGYVQRQEADIRSFRRDEALRIPADLDYGALGGLSTEVREKLDRVRPETLGRAGRVAGVTPAALIALLKHVRREDRRSA